MCAFKGLAVFTYHSQALFQCLQNCLWTLLAQALFQIMTEWFSFDLGVGFEDMVVIKLHGHVFFRSKLIPCPFTLGKSQIGICKSLSVDTHKQESFVFWQIKKK